MKPYQIHLSDWVRILFGEVPASFYFELVIRALIIYIILMFSMRAMGKRMSSQLSRNELSALVSLAAAVGVPMMAPNRGILPAMVIAIIVVCVQRFVASKAANNQAFEKLSQGNISILIREGIVDVDALERTGLSKGELFEQLRGQAVMQLGEVDRFYMEANGAFTLIKAPSLSFGLSVLPKDDKAILSEFEIEPGKVVCNTCGFKKEGKTSEKGEPCERCTQEVWLPAVKQQQQ